MADTHSSRAPVLFEACVDSVAGAVQAVNGGAYRLELCEALIEGGLTPSIGKIRKVIESCKAVNPAIIIHVIIRPRSRDFCYTGEEVAVMLEDIAAVKVAGADGIVLGILRPDGSINAEETSALVEAARPMKVTFHRAIDVARDPLEAFQECRRLGIDYVLTSGRASSALLGAAVIKQMVSMRDADPSYPIVIAGGGVTPYNAAELVRLTGVQQIHSTARRTVGSEMTYIPKEIIYMGGEKKNTPEDELSWKCTCRELVRRIIAAANAV